MRLRLLPATRQDLVEITRFGRAWFGAATSARYWAAIPDRLADLRSSEASGTAEDEVAAGLRRILVGSHTV